MSRPITPDHKQSGFTILELLIATALLSVILLLITTMMIGIGSLYYKGINQARVQDATRNISDSMSRDLQLTSQHVVTATASGTVNEIAYCVANVRYTATSGRQISTSPKAGTTQVRHVLWRDTVSSAGTCVPVDLTLAAPNSAALPGNSGAELIPVNSRLIDFNVTAPAAFPGTYTITVGVAYGDDDLLCSPVISPGSCATNTAMAPLTKYYPDPVTNLYPANNHFLCKGSKGDQFCATAGLKTTVVQRISN